jgi:hypothetical protein
MVWDKSVIVPTISYLSKDNILTAEPLRMQSENVLFGGEIPPNKNVSLQRSEPSRGYWSLRKNSVLFPKGYGF